MSKGLKIALFLLLTVLLHFGVFLLFKKITANKSELLKEEESIEALGSIDLLIIGDSHAKRCVDPDQIASSFNSAYYGENPALTYYHLKHLVNDLKIKPKRVLFQIDITRFAKNFLRHYKNKFFYQTFVDNDELRDLDIITNEQWLENELFKVAPQLEFLSVVKRVNNNEKNTKKTFASFSNAERKKMAHDFISKQLIPNGFDDLYDQTSLSYLKKTIQFCQENQIKLIAIKYPVTDYYLKELEDICQRDLSADTPQDKIIQDWKIPLIDFEHSFLKDYELYSDSHHMNPEGKKRCTALLIQKLDSLQSVNNP